MKLAKMSLVAALALTANMYAIDNVKVNGDVKVFYGTMDASYEGSKQDYLGNDVQTSDMFNKENSYADAALHLGLTADLSEGVSAGMSMTAVSTLGLENNLVSNTWSNTHGVSNSNGASFVGQAAAPVSENIQLDDEMWIDEMWIAGTAFDTTVKLGRQALDTPLAFTETWGIDTNTFEAAVLINQSIPDTTIVATYIGKSNGSADDQATALSLGTVNGGVNVTGGTLNELGRAQAGYVAQGGKFNTFGKDGVYAAGVINNSFKPLTAQAWYYDMQGLAKAYWLQADIKCSLVKGVLIGVQYANTDADSASAVNAYLGLSGTPLVTSVNDTSMYSVMLGYEMKDVVTVKAAYSSVSDDGTLGMANTATGAYATSGGQSKMYTEMWWNYGAVSAVGADSYSITAEGTVGPEVDLLLGYYFADIDPKGANNAEEVAEIAFTATKSFGPLDATLALIYDDYSYDVVSRGDTKDMTNLQVYLTYNF